MEAVHGRTIPEFLRVIVFLALFLALLPASSATEKKPPPRRDYVGDAACRSCHQEESKNYPKTAHHLSTSWPSARTMRGNFTPGSNILKTANPYLHFEMTANKDGYFQSAVEEPGPGKTITRTERIDIVTGPRKGQSYLFWKGDQLFQLPVTYWTETNSWVNSRAIPMGRRISTKRLFRGVWSVTQVISIGSAANQPVRQDQHGAGNRLRKVPRPRTRTRRAPSLEVSVTRRHVGGDRQPSFTLARPANGCMRFMPFGKWHAHRSILVFRAGR